MLSSRASIDRLNGTWRGDADTALTRAVVTRPLSGEPPTIELVMGYSSANASPLLKRFLARAEELIENVSRQQKLRG
jgi:LysR family hca operon transcriptional activator